MPVPGKAETRDFARFLAGALHPMARRGSQPTRILRGERAEFEAVRNWRAEFKYEHLVSERRVLWKRGEGVSHGLSHAASHATREKTILKPKPPRPPAVAATVAAATNFAMHRRNFSQKAKEAIVLETLKPGTTVTDVARRYQIAPRVLFRWRADMALGTPDVEPGFATVSVSSEENLPGVEVKS